MRGACLWRWSLGLSLGQPPSSWPRAILSVIFFSFFFSFGAAIIYIFTHTHTHTHTHHRKTYAFTPLCPRVPNHSGSGSLDLG
jgi:hypothetical protein